MEKEMNWEALKASLPYVLPFVGVPIGWYVGKLVFWLRDRKKSKLKNYGGIVSSPGHTHTFPYYNNQTINFEGTLSGEDAERIKQAFMNPRYLSRNPQTGLITGMSEPIRNPRTGTMMIRDDPIDDPIETPRTAIHHQLEDPYEIRKGLPTSQVVCKHCSTIYLYPEDRDKEYFIDSSDLVGLVTCRACMDQIECNKREKFENPKCKSLHSRKIKWRAKT
jgi:hypothetical protein